MLSFAERLSGADSSKVPRRNLQDRNLHLLHVGLLTLRDTVRLLHPNQQSRVGPEG
jgi:hypothetical protein